MNKVENRRHSAREQLHRDIERLREELNQQTDIGGPEALKISLELDKLIIKAMKQNGYHL